MQNEDYISFFFDHRIILAINGIDAAVLTLMHASASRCFYVTFIVLIIDNSNISMQHHTFLAWYVKQV